VNHNALPRATYHSARREWIQHYFFELIEGHAQIHRYRKDLLGEVHVQHLASHELRQRIDSTIDRPALGHGTSHGARRYGQRTRYLRGALARVRQRTDGCFSCLLRSRPTFRGHRGGSRWRSFAPGTQPSRVSITRFCHTVLDTQQRLDDALSRINMLQIERAVLEQRLALLAETAAATHRLAYHDELTGLPNRRLLGDRFHQAAAHGARHSYQIAVLLFDLDGFKCINDTLGHAVGDKLLLQVAMRLAGAVRASDTACRLGGDEFLVLLEEVDEESTLWTAAKIRAQLCMPYLIGGSAIKITTSVGTATCPLAGERYESLMRRADLAMYHDKARGPTPPTITTGLLHESSDWRVA